MEGEAPATKRICRESTDGNGGGSGDAAVGSKPTATNKENRSNKKSSKSLNSKKARQKRRKGEKPAVVLKFVPAGDTFQYTPTPAALATAKRLYEGKCMLAPMVRAGTTPLRILALRYGADTVFSEEIIDYKMMNVKRVENAELKTVDYVVEKKAKKNKLIKSLILRVDPAVEKGRFVFQMGTSNGKRALQALRKSGILQDAAAIDINMGCPKHFSVQGGMGAALLANQRNAAEIVHTLASNLGDVPVSAKIRLLSGDGLQPTVEFMRVLERAGASAIAIHLRTAETPSERAANWTCIRALSEAVQVPVTINGDFMTPSDIAFFRTEFDRRLGVMVARGALKNCSLFKWSHVKHGSDVAEIFDGSQAPSAASRALQVSSRGSGHGRLCTKEVCKCGEVQDDPHCTEPLDSVIRRLLVRFVTQWHHLNGS